MDYYDEALNQQIKLADFWLSSSGRETLRYHFGECDEDPELVDMAIAMFAFPLMAGECFYWSEDICDLVWSASQGVPMNFSLLPDALPTPLGFFWLKKSLDYGWAPWQQRSIRAISWVPLTLAERTKVDNLIIVGPQPKGEEDNVLVFGRPSMDLSELKTGDTIAISFFLDDPTYPMSAPLTNLLYPIGMAIGTALRSNGEHLRHPELAERKLKLFAAMLVFLQQKILVPYRQRPNRATRRRAEKAKRPDAVVSIVKLREIVCHGHREAQEAVQWTCRWLVRGHWRNQWYRTRKYHQLRWIAPYLKGPKDKPIREASRLFAVVR